MRTPRFAQPQRLRYDGTNRTLTTLSAVLREHGTPGRHRLYPPIDTLRLLIGQVLSVDRACQDGVGRRLSERIANGQSVSALSTSAYC